MRITIRRFVELLLLMVIMSAVATFLYTNTLVPSTRSAVGVVMLFLSVLYFLCNGFMLSCCYDAAYQMADYYIYNAVAYLLFAAVNGAIYMFCDSNTYIWLFSLTKTFSVLFENISTLWSVGIFNVIIVLLIIIAPWVGNH